MKVLAIKPGQDGSLELSLELEFAEAPRVCAEWLKARALWLAQDFSADFTVLRPLRVRIAIAAHELSVKARCVQLSSAGAALELLEMAELASFVESFGADLEEVSESQQIVEDETVEAEGELEKDLAEEELEGESEEEMQSEGEAVEEKPAGPLSRNAKKKTEGKGSLYHRLKALSIEEKKRLAVKANQPERYFLARDNAQGIHIFVLRNPGVTATEVVEFLKYPRLSSEAIMHIGKTTEWMSNRRVVMGLCMHARTPTNITMRLISRLSARDLKALQRSGKMKPVLAREIKTRLYKLNHEK